MNQLTNFSPYPSLPPQINKKHILSWGKQKGKERRRKKAIQKTHEYKSIEEFISELAESKLDLKQDLRA